jgi:hypothetical protein
MKTLQSEASSSPAVHCQNISSQLSQLIGHLEADTRRVNDQRFRALLEKSAEVLKSLRTLFERFGSSDQGNRTNQSGAAGRASRGESRNSAATGKSSETGRSLRRPKVNARASQAGGQKNNGPQGEARPAKVVQPFQKGATSTAKPEPMPATSRPYDPDETAAKAQQQRKEARAPRMPGGHGAPKPMPPQSGKPIWDKPHSS